jgi:hypothetical protein
MLVGAVHLSVRTIIADERERARPARPSRTT